MNGTTNGFSVLNLIDLNFDSGTKELILYQSHPTNCNSQIEKDSMPLAEEGCKEATVYMKTAWYLCLAQGL